MSIFLPLVQDPSLNKCVYLWKGKMTKNYNFQSLQDIECVFGEKERKKER